MEILAEVRHYINVVLVKEQLSHLGSSFRSLLLSKLSVLALPIPQPMSHEDLLRISLETNCPPDVVFKFWSDPIETSNGVSALFKTEPDNMCTSQFDFSTYPISSANGDITDISKNAVSASRNVINVTISLHQTNTISDITSSPQRNESSAMDDNHVLPNLFASSQQFNEISLTNSGAMPNLFTSQQFDNGSSLEIGETLPNLFSSQQLHQTPAPTNAYEVDNFDACESSHTENNKFESSCMPKRVPYLEQMKSEERRWSSEGTGVPEEQVTAVENGKEHVAADSKREQQEQARKKAFVCQTCPKSFNKERVLLSHKYSCKQTLKCEKCDKTFTSFTTMKRHMKTHAESNAEEDPGGEKCRIKSENPEKPNEYICSVCGMIFTKRFKLKKHVVTHTVADNTVSHPGPNNALQHCHVCGEVFKTVKELNVHMIAHPGEKPFKCHICGKTVANSKSLSYHMYSHSDNPEAAKKFTCHICGRRFRFGSHLKEHMMVHSGERPYQCEVCSHAFAHPHTLKNHMSTHGLGEPKKHCCDLCGRLFQKQFHLKTHMLTHVENRERFECEVCHKSFAWEDSLITHRRIHTGERPFSCKFCSHTFVGAAARRNHIRFVHENDKPYPCTKCDHRCRDKNSYNKHMRRHTGEKPYICPHCLRAFATKSTLTAHIKTHTGEKPHKCTMCTYGCIQSTDLRKHMVKVHSVDHESKIQTAYYDNYGMS